MQNNFKYIWNSKWVLSVTAGALLGLSWPPFPFPFLVFPAFLLLFRLIDLCSSAREAAFMSYPAFLIWNIITTYWLVMATVAGGVAAILANAAVMTVPVMLIYLSEKRLDGPVIIALFQTAFWISYEYLHHLWDLAWPWLAVGNAWANVPELVQYISATGYLGISFWVIFTSSIAYQALKGGSHKLGFAAAGVALLFPSISLIQLPFLDSQSKIEGKVEVVVAQPNFDSYQDYGGFPTAEQSLNMMIALTDSVRTPSTQVVVWPENGIYPNIASRKVSNPTTNLAKSRLISQAREWKATIIAGTRYYEYFDPAEAPPLPHYSGDTPYLRYNSALSFQPDSTIKVYRKYNLVPIVERVPFIHFLNALDAGGWIDWAAIQGFGKGHSPDHFQIASTRTPALICYDSVFPGWVREFVSRGAGFITIITNDGWWGDTSGHEQHFAYARLRALEFRRWVVRSANNGISGIIAPNGDVKIETGYWTRTAFRYRVPVIHRQTLYARFGDWLPYSMLLLSVIGTGIFMYKSKPDS